MQVGKNIRITDAKNTTLAQSVVAHVLEYTADGRVHLVLPYGDYAMIYPDEVDYITID